MGIPRVNSCCCGCSLRTGTLILLYLTLVGGVLAPFGKTQIKDADGKAATADVPMSAKLPGAIIIIAVAVAGLYGVYTERQGFILPYLILDTLSVIGFLIFAVMALLVNILFGLIFFLIALLPVYFWLVVYNHYRELEEGKRGSSAA